MTVIKQCKCENTFQDSQYGKGNRVFNEGEKDDKCTVCGAKSGSNKPKGKK